LSLIASFSSLSQGQTVANPPSIDFVNDASTPSDCLGIRPAHLWSFDYAKLLWSDTGAVLTATNAFQFKPFSNNQSFPSGHSSQAFAVATAIAENYPVWWVQTLCYGGAGLVGYARIEQNAHYASDVVAGALLGWAVAHAVVHRHNGCPPNSEKLNWSLCAEGGSARLVFFKSF
jgi:hypothetical protein